GAVMRKFLLGTASLIALVTPAMAADMRASLYKAPPLAAVWSWTGCYLGGHAGGLWAKQKDWVVRTPGGAFFGQSLGGHEADGWLGGAQAGCDYQFAGGFLIGVQGDYAWAGVSIGIGGEYAFTNFLSGFVEYNYFDFGTRQVGFTPQVAGLGPAFADVKETKSVVRAGLNFRFGG